MSDDVDIVIDAHRSYGQKFTRRDAIILLRVVARIMARYRARPFADTPMKDWKPFSTSDLHIVGHELERGMS